MGSARIILFRGAMLTMLLMGVALWTTPAAAQDAAATFKAKCAMCHGADGKASTPAGQKMGAHDFASPEVQKASDAELAETITKGKNKMPAYGGKLKDSEIKELVAYVRQLGKAK
jgi:mono/diheme cytochrome c family protein